MRRLALAAAIGALLTGPAAAQPHSEPAPADVPATVQSIHAADAEGILGKSVWGANGENMGLVVDVIVDRAGVPAAAIIDFGGFLGVGSRKIAVDWNLLEFHPADAKTPITLDLNPAALKSAPEYKPSAEPIQVVGAPPDPSRGGK